MMNKFNRNLAIKKITEMSKEQLAKVLIFMAGMEAEHIIIEQNKIDQQREPPKNKPA